MLSHILFPRHAAAVISNLVVPMGALVSDNKSPHTHLLLPQHILLKNKELVLDFLHFIGEREAKETSPLCLQWTH